MFVRLLALAELPALVLCLDRRNCLELAKGCGPFESRKAVRLRAMRLFTILTTGICVFVHSVFGCCAASVPASEGGVAVCCSASVTKDCVVNEHACCGQEFAHEKDRHVESKNQDRDDDRPESPSEHECRHDHCQWLVGNDGQNSIDLKIEWLFVSCFPIQPTLASTTGAGREAIHRNRFNSKAPLRLYLEISVLLL